MCGSRKLRSLERVYNAPRESVRMFRKGRSETAVLPSWLEVYQWDKSLSSQMALLQVATSCVGALLCNHIFLRELVTKMGVSVITPVDQVKVLNIKISHKVVAGRCFQS